MRTSKSRAAIVVAIVSVVIISGIVGVKLSPARAEQVAATIDRVFTVVNCHSANACDGGVNADGGFGVLASSAKNNGVDASTTNKSKTRPGRSGVYGHDDSTDGGKLNVGVAGYSPNGFGMQASSTNGIGLQATSTNGTAIFASSASVGIIANATDNGLNIGIDGNSNAGDGVGVEGYSANGPGLLGFVATGSPETVLELDAGTADSGGNAMEAYDSNGSLTFTLDNAGNVTIPGLIFTKGFCKTGCSPTHRITEYSPRESVPTMEDIGEGQLVGGKAYVPLDPVYANVINSGASYVVFVSPEGPNQGLYVTQKTARGFEVLENPGGHSTIPFGYRIVAKPYGVTAARLPMSVQTDQPMRLRLQRQPHEPHQ